MDPKSGHRFVEAGCEQIKKPAVWRVFLFWSVILVFQPGSDGNIATIHTNRFL